MTAQRLFGWRHAFDHPVVFWVTMGVAGLIVLALLGSVLLKGDLRREVLKRTLAWAAMAPLILGPVLLGAAWHFAAVTLVSLICYAEFARATGLFREKVTSLTVVLGILAVGFAALDNYYRLFVALFPIVVCVVAAASILPDSPKGYLQRVALGALAFMLFGAGLGHLSFMGNDANYRPMVLLLLLGAQMNDVFAFCVGKTMGRRKLVPNTSPNKTVAGAVGALVLTTLLVASLGRVIFRGTPLGGWGALVPLGLLLSVAGQLGDLTLSSIKRDLGIKDMGSIIPGHGGVLDRANSLLLSAPAVFHYVNYFVGFGLDQPARIFTRG
ncbi:MAG TPA: phosphatidate cytidylyltransferase [Planctomycetota bacterium]